MATPVQKYLNPPFDPRMLTIGPPSLGSKNLVRGRMVSADKNAATGMKHGVHFLYNPVAITASHNTDISAVGNGHSAQYSSGSVQTQTGQVANIGSVGVDLLYDRTYELWDASQAGSMAGKFGVYADVLAFYMLLGITKTGAQTDSGLAAMLDLFQTSAGKITSSTWQSLYPTNGISPDNRMYLYMGGDAVEGDKMRFYGLVSDFSVTYSHWTQKMVPVRATVSIGLQFQSDPAAVDMTVNRGTTTATPKKSATSSITTKIPGSTAHKKRKKKR